jgi:hypothetical protein
MAALEYWNHVLDLTQVMGVSVLLFICVFCVGRSALMERNVLSTKVYEFCI